MGQEFDQDAVHVRDFNYEVKESDTLNTLREDGSAIVPYVTADFNKPLSVEEFNEMAQATGMGGGSLSADGLTAMFYLADLDPENRENNINQFYKNVEKLKNYDSKGVKTINQRTGYTQLWQIERGTTSNSGQELQGTYEWYSSEFYPKLTEDTRRRLLESENRSAWARQQLSEKVYQWVSKVFGLRPKRKDLPRLKSIGNTLRVCYSTLSSYTKTTHRM